MQKSGGRFQAEGTSWDEIRDPVGQDKKKMRSKEQETCNSAYLADVEPSGSGMYLEREDSAS